MDIRQSYDSAARGYTQQVAGELVHKPLDRHLLARFAESVRDLGRVADVGCGPGHVAQYLHELGVKTVGIDLSPGMIECATEKYPAVEFRVGDMQHLDFGDASLAGIVSFYSIVHFKTTELGDVFREFRRVLMPAGLVLIAFHIGDEVLHRDEFFGAQVSLDFTFHRPDAVIDALKLAGLEVIEQTKRAPYPDVEFPSERCYLLARMA